MQADNIASPFDLSLRFVPFFGVFFWPPKNSLNYNIDILGRNYGPNFIGSTDGNFSTEGSQLQTLPMPRKLWQAVDGGE